MIAVVVVSPIPTVLAGLAALVGSADDLQVLDEVRGLDDLAGPAALAGADVVLIDLADDDESAEAVTALDGVGLGAVMLGAAEGAARLPRVAPSVPWGYLPRDAAGDRIVAAIRAVAAGLVVLDPELAVLGPGRVAPDPLRLEAAPDDLTAREREVLSLVSLGLTNKAIARRLGVSDSTVKFHVASVLAKLGAESRTEAVHLGARRGLIAL